MASYIPESDIILETQDHHNATARAVTLKNATEDVEEAAAVPGEKLHRWVFVSFSFLCILQASLNISLRLVSSSQVNIRTTERHELKNRTNELGASQQDSLITERDDLKRQLVDLSSRHNALTSEMNELKKMMNDFEWLCFGGSAYYISESTNTWENSRNDCLQRGADLVIINSKEEQEFLRMYQKVSWIGLTEIEEEGVWKWVDGTQLTESYWRPWEPNNYRGNDEDCVEIKDYSSKQSWNDALCSVKKYWICEKKIIT